jgi:hypothetical protein
VDGPIIRRLQVDEIPAMQVLRREVLTSDPLAFGATAEDDVALDSAFATRSLSDPSTAAIFAAFVASTPVDMVGLARMPREKIKHRALSRPRHPPPDGSTNGPGSWCGVVSHTRWRGAGRSSTKTIWCWPWLPTMRADPVGPW